MNYAINYIVLFTGLLLSSISAYYSVIGLTAIFPASFWPIVIMGGSLELAKIVAASWLYRNWKTCPKLMKGYIFAAIITLILITSMGTFGFLSRAHIQQGVQQASVTHEIQAIQIQLSNEERRLKNAQRALDNLDSVVEKVSAENATATRQRQRNERASLDKEIKDASTAITTLNKQMLPLKQQNDIATSELGPVKYITEMIYGEESTKYQDQAIRFLIIIIVFVFDPLAILLIIAANIGFTGDLGLNKYRQLIRDGLKTKI